MVGSTFPFFQMEEWKQDKYTKRLTTKAYVFLFLHAQFQYLEGLRTPYRMIFSENERKKSAKRIDLLSINEVKNTFVIKWIVTIFSRLLSFFTKPKMIKKIQYN
jgi:hypothetical protein